MIFPIIIAVALMQNADGPRCRPPVLRSVAAVAVAPVRLVRRIAPVRRVARVSVAPMRLVRRIAPVRRVVRVGFSPIRFLRRR